MVLIDALQTFKSKHGQGLLLWIEYRLNNSAAIHIENDIGIDGEIVLNKFAGKE